MIQVSTSSSLKTTSEITVPEKEVKKGTKATVECSLTALDKAVTISWFAVADSNTALTAGDGECSARKLQR